jgi:hypothetical protein
MPLEYWTNYSVVSLIDINLFRTNLFSSVTSPAMIHVKYLVRIATPRAVRQKRSMRIWRPVSVKLHRHIQQLCSDSECWSENTTLWISTGGRADGLKSLVWMTELCMCLMNPFSIAWAGCLKFSEDSYQWFAAIEFLSFWYNQRKVERTSLSERWPTYWGCLENDQFHVAWRIKCCVSELGRPIARVLSIAGRTCLRRYCYKYTWCFQFLGNYRDTDLSPNTRYDNRILRVL